MSPPVVALAGNPNSGKTTLFNALTGSRAKVGNYPGVTVEQREAPLALPRDATARLVDVPGAYSLSARTEEERVAVAAIAGLAPFEPPDVVVVVVDGTQLARNLYLTLQVLELCPRVVVAVTMRDVLEKNRVVLDARRLAQRLGVPVVPVCAARDEGLDELREAVATVLAAPAERPASASFDADQPAVTAAVDAVCEHVPDAWARDDDVRRRALARWALMSLDEHDELDGVPDGLRAAVLERRDAAERAGVDLDEAIVAVRYAWIDGVVREVLGDAPRALRAVSDRVDRVLVHPAVGFWIFLAVMAVVFEALFSWSAPMIDAVDGAVAAAGGVVGAWMPEGLARDFVLDGLVAGVGAVLVFLPQILLLFLFIGLLEDSGYMARVAFLMDRVMKGVGLTGRAFVPMLSGFACAIPAVMATRTMERRRDRMLTMLVVPIMTCSARLPVYTLIIGALFPAPGDPGGTLVAGISTQAGLMVAMYLFSTVLALLAAALLGRTLLRGEDQPLLLELPPYRLPRARSVLRQMVERSRLFVSEAGTVILACTIVLWVLLTFPRDATLDVEAPGGADTVVAAEAAAAEQLAASWGGRMGHALEPYIEPLGFDWKIGIGLIGSFAAREVFVSTMGVVYGVGDEVDETSVSLRDRLRAERGPDGDRVYTPLVGVSLMVFFALAAQCMSTLAVIKRETGGYRWAAFVFVYMTALAWGASLCVYQGGKLLGLA